MGRPQVSVPLRILCAAVALLMGWISVRIGVTGEFRAKNGIVELDLWARCLMVGVLGLMTIVAGWAAAMGRD
jgi:purine-cytosine permease-like protein